MSEGDGSCDLCASGSPIYQLTNVCCCARLILDQPSRDRRATILALIERRPEYADAEAVRKAVEAAFGSGRPSQTRTTS